uniref:Receptor-like serine/threonine-protein kinase n=1 Tax=Leersia perrieri TaxID=77586 RepID=A0A0D9WA06_9ORYZ
MWLTRPPPDLLPFLLGFFVLSGQIFAAVSLDKLEKGQNLTDGQTLVSSGLGSYTLGFFSPGKSTKRYLGIWFTVSNDTVYWVANRDRPIDGNSGVLLLNDGGSLVLLDGARRPVWSANFLASSAAVVQLLDTGNLVVRNGSSIAYLWQSFDQPTDTLLPDMRMGKILWNGDELYIQAWRSDDDPSPGDYRRVLTTEGLPELVLWRGGAKIYRTGPWNGKLFNGVPEAANYSNMYPLHVTISETERTYGYKAMPYAPLTRVVVNHTGFVERLVWDKSSRAWHQFFIGPGEPCDSYARCGPFGLCDPAAAAKSYCGCLTGFSVASPLEAALKNFTGGCRRNVALDCVAGAMTTDKFAVIRGVKLPDTLNASVDKVITMDECEQRCSANCSCVAYAAADINSTGCVIWTDDIVDVRYDPPGQDLYVRLAKAEFAETKPESKRSLTVPIFTPVAAVVIAFILIGFCAWAVWWRKKIRIVHIPEDPEMGVRSVNLATIKSITAKFSENRFIGEGGFSKVYKGESSDGRMFAVKRLKPSALTIEGKKYFAREVAVMAGLRHNNLLRLLAYCNEGDERILIYTYMENGSLNSHIFGNSTHRANLDWRRRLDMILGIAKGVVYLHEGTDRSVIHRDLKPSNILLDDEWKPKIGDFGTAKLFFTDQSGGSGTSGPTMVGSEGYVSPEYLSQGEMTLKCDVYSYGVVLLETLSGIRNGRKRELLPRVWESWNQNKLIDLLHQAMPTPASDEIEVLPDLELERCIQIGLLCVQDMADDRPSMSEVVTMMTSKTAHIEQPKKPTFDCS